MWRAKIRGDIIEIGQILASAQRGKTMKLQEYRMYLQGQHIPSDSIEQQMIIVGDFTKFLTDLDIKETTHTSRKEEVA